MSGPMAGTPEDPRRNDRWLRERAIALAIFVASLLVFTWPFVRSPAPPLGASYVDLLVAWTASVVVLGAAARVFGRRPPRRKDDDA